MARLRLTPLSALLALFSVALNLPASAQESGGLHLAPGINGGPVGLARPLPFTRMPLVTAHDVQGGMTGLDHQAQNQDMVTRLRGDPGYLAGFSMGTPLAASRQTPVASGDGAYYHRHHHGQQDSPIIINNEGPLALTMGNGNVVQQQSSTGSGPAAQQQVVTIGGSGSTGGGALNLVTNAGNIIQRAPASH